MLDVLKLPSPPTPIIMILTALDRALNFNFSVDAFTTDRACTPSSDIKGGKADIQLRCESMHNQHSITPHPLYYNYMV